MGGCRPFRIVPALLFLVDAGVLRRLQALLAADRVASGLLRSSLLFGALLVGERSVLDRPGKSWLAAAYRRRDQVLQESLLLDGVGLEAEPHGSWSPRAPGLGLLEVGAQRLLPAASVGQLLRRALRRGLGLLGPPRTGLRFCLPPAAQRLPRGFEGRQSTSSQATATVPGVVHLECRGLVRLAEERFSFVGQLIGVVLAQPVFIKARVVQRGALVSHMRLQRMLAEEHVQLLPLARGLRRVP